jgi:hypothetical protein
MCSRYADNHNNDTCCTQQGEALRRMEGELGFSIPIALVCSKLPYGFDRVKGEHKARQQAVNLRVIDWQGWSYFLLRRMMFA